MKQLTHLYDQLTAKERFTVAVEALARGDLGELDKLNDTCPRKRYEIGDLAYHTRLNELWRMALLAKHEMLELSHNLTALLAVIVTLEGGDREDSECYERVTDAYERGLASLKGKRAAWDDFCCELGLIGDDVLYAFKLSHADDDMAGLVLSVDLGNDMPVDETVRQKTLQAMRGCWVLIERRLE